MSIFILKKSNYYKFNKQNIIIQINLIFLH